jgi:Holliday junction resolvase
MNNSRKGTRNERELDKALQQAGYETYRPEKAQYGDNDIMGLFDIMAVHPIGMMLLVQCKSNQVDHINQWFENVSTYYAMPSVQPMYAVRHDKEGWRIAQATADGYEWFYDGRSDGNIGEQLPDRLKPNVSGYDA